ncbi:nucleoside diphosphate kinase regulator [Geobacter sp. SVR]|uniref:nucleoside diphosphate kinase regulator n=1 Tax=Geobacter sp. SVR TaxID=2495594 RepID=UPI00143EF971|nr:nucleoside diphosphate kinase regulator [Geobacter sp. SVR]BCS52805.1 RNA polymerase-binding protein Rnk [Geobacter sp. SVR]GCF86671.1 RNA polymerase-binding protein Rnk [Geobacter sp. SVR]
MKARNNSSRQIFITDFDLERLEELIETTSRNSSRDGRYLHELEQELTKAEVVTPAGIPPDVITMNSRVCLRDMESGEDLIYTLVFPGDADLENNRISVLAPIGTAMIGYRTGDTITWQVPGGTRRFKVRKVLYQPEAAGDYHL